MISRRTNYQRKQAFRDKPVRRVMSTKYLEDELDAIVRLILPLMESACFTCGATKNLQVSHLFERRHRLTRWDTSPEGNNHLMCKQENANHENHPEVYTNKFLKRFGERAFADVADRAHSNQKLTYSDLLDLLEQKEQQLLKLQGKAA